MGLRATEVILSPAAESALEGLKGRPVSIARRVENLAAILREDCLHGEVVRGRSLPRQLVERYQVRNLYVEDLPDLWRLLYTVTHSGPDRYVIILEIVSHREYDRWFPGRRR